jgi:Protein of unknown function (DUF4232)
MNLHASTVARRILASGAVTCAAALIPAAALASSGSGAGTATPACATAGLDVWMDTSGGVAAGTAYYRLELTNLSGGTCTLSGYPGVSGVTLAGTPLGSAAGRNGSAPHTVTLADGATAHAVLGIVDVYNYPASQCRMTTAAGLRVYPPNQTQSRVAPFPFLACSKSGPVYLTIGPTQSGP